mmetsp:Transcript_43186/g.130514  ORF Transcript_43186/g.130514 Transcript_43186/m.130514 type:complete len:322 (+) Transcript_43186:769-1734(+)
MACDGRIANYCGKGYWVFRNRLFRSVRHGQGHGGGQMGAVIAHPRRQVSARILQDLPAASLVQQRDLHPVCLERERGEAPFANGGAPGIDEPQQRPHHLGSDVADIDVVVVGHPAEAVVGGGALPREQGPEEGRCGGQGQRVRQGDGRRSPWGREADIEVGCQRSAVVAREPGRDHLVLLGRQRDPNIAVGNLGPDRPEGPVDVPQAEGLGEPERVEEVLAPGEGCAAEMEELHEPVHGFLARGDLVEGGAEVGHAELLAVEVQGEHQGVRAEDHPGASASFHAEHMLRRATQIRPHLLEQPQEIAHVPLGIDGHRHLLRV